VGARLATSWCAAPRGGLPALLLPHLSSLVGPKDQPSPARALEYPTHVKLFPLAELSPLDSRTAARQPADCRFHE
jgi:hypothetical protein